MATARGRTPASKPLTASTASSRSKQATKRALSANSSSTSTLAKSTRPPTVAPRAAAASADARVRVPPKPASKPAGDSAPAKSSFTVVSAIERETKFYPTPSSLAPPIEEQPPARTSDPLQIAAQVYPWLYMTSTLEACFQSAEESAKKELDVRAKALDAEESEIADQRIRFEAERNIDFYDELASDTFAKEAPLIMQSFLTHGDECTRVEAEALNLAMNGPSSPDDDAPLQIYNDMLDNLDELQATASNLETSIIALTAPASTDADTISESESDATTSPRSQIIGVFAACLPVLRARVANLSMAQELIDSAQENLSISLRMESLGLE